MNEKEELLREAAKALNSEPEQLPVAIAKLQGEITRIEAEIRRLKK